MPNQESRVNCAQDKLEEISKQILIEVDEGCDPGVPSSLQLVQWMLREHGGQVPYPANQFAADLLEESYMISDWDPISIRKLLGDDEGSIQLEGKDAIDLASILIENLHDHLQHQMPQLRSPETL